MTKKTWIGKYGYLYDNAESDFYSFEINATLEKGSFEGTVFEEEFSGATGDLVAVKGFIDGDFISFVKTYPYGYWRDEDDKVIVDKDVSGSDVTYQGNFDSDTGVWKGDWEIEISVDPIIEGTDDIQVVVGVWEMQTKNQDKDKLFELISIYLNKKTNLTEDSDIQYDLGIYGDEAVDLLNEYSKEFGVDISNFDFNRYFHPEGGVFFPKLSKKFSRKKNKLSSISVKDLLDGISKKVFIKDIS